MVSELTASRIRQWLLLGALVVGGALLAVVAYQLWSLSTRYFYAFIAGILLVCFSTLFLRRFSDFLMVAFMCCVPLASFSKYFLLESVGATESEPGILRYSGLVCIGVLDIVLAGLYLTWLIRIFVTRTASIPRFTKLDGLVLVLIASYALSIPGTPVPLLGYYAILNLLRFVAIYIYVSRNFQRVHIPWLFASVVLVVVLEGGLAVVQYTTGKYVGLAQDRGAGVRLDEQYEVPGIEHRNRATGTVSESHTFGIYITMLAQFALVMTLDPNARKRIRLLGALVFVIAAGSVLISFSRSAWISFAVGTAIVWCMHLKWGERHVIAPAIFLVAISLVFLPWAVDVIAERFDAAGDKNLEERFYQYPVAWNIWMDHPLFGYGVGNYMEALNVYNVSRASNLPVHNVFLWIAAETGLLGIFAFFSIAIVGIVKSWKTAVGRHDPLCRVALAVLAGLAAYLVDGITDPLYREPVVYTMYWFSIGLAAALVRIDRQPSQPSTPPTAVTQVSD